MRWRFGRLERHIEQVTFNELNYLLKVISADRFIGLTTTNTRFGSPPLLTQAISATGRIV
jgi:hypothetical protein